MLCFGTAEVRQMFSQGETGVFCTADVGRMFWYWSSKTDVFCIAEVRQKFLVQQRLDRYFWYWRSETGVCWWE